MVAEKIVALQSAIGSELTQRDLVSAFTVSERIMIAKVNIYT